MLLIGDLHLGNFSSCIIQENGLSSRLNDTITRLYELLDIAIKLGTGITILGDIFETAHPRPYVIEEFVKFLNTANVYQVYVTILPGNHDAAYDHTAINFIREIKFKYINVIDEISVDTIFNTGYFPQIPLKYHTETFYSECVEKLKGCEVILGHAHVPGCVLNDESNLNIGNAMLFESEKYDCKLAFMGHIHQHQTIGNVVYVGSPVPQNFGEADNKCGYIDLNMNTLDWKFCEFKTKITEYKNITIDLLNKDEIIWDLNKVKELCQDKLLKIEVYSNDIAKVNESEIKKVFNQFGTILKFKVIIQKSKIDLDDIVIVSESYDYNMIFHNWLTVKGHTKNERLDAEAIFKKIQSEV